MAHVVLDAKSHPPRLLIDGVDVALTTLANSITITDTGDEWVVSLTIAPTALDVDLPEAVLDVMRDQSDEPSLSDQLQEINERLEDFAHAFDPMRTGQAVVRDLSRGERGA